MGKREIEDEVKREFLTERHFEALSRLIVHEPDRSNQGKLNLIVSFRKAGERAIRMLAAGAGAKPHKILDKSVKRERLERIFSEQDIAAVPNIERICGLVARPVVREADLPAVTDMLAYPPGAAEPVDLRKCLNIAGLYLTRAGAEHFEGLDRFTVKRDAQTCYLEVDGALTGLIERFTTSQGEILPAEHYAKWFISGDYDIHDLICLSGSSRHPVVSDSPDEIRFLTKMNDAMTGKDRFSQALTKFTPDEYDPIQHGPQYNYIVYTYNHEPKTKINEQVAQIDCPVAVCDKNGWHIMQEPMELVEYYEQNAVKVKELWNLSEEGKAYLRQISNKSLDEHMDEITGRKRVQV